MPKQAGGKGMSPKGQESQKTQQHKVSSRSSPSKQQRKQNMGGGENPQAAPGAS